MSASDLRYNSSDEGDLIVWKPVGQADSEDRYDWETFYLEVIRLAHDKRGAGIGAVDLQDHMRRWCLLTWRRCPTEELLRDKLEPVARKLESGSTFSPCGGDDGKTKKTDKKAAECPFFFP